MLTTKKEQSTPVKMGSAFAPRLLYYILKLIFCQYAEKEASQKILIVQI